MTKAESQLLAARATRNAAKAAFDERSAQVKGDIETRGIGGRIADRLSDEARKGAEQAIEVASESKLIVAAVVGAFTLWFLRHPIIAWIDELRDDKKVTDDE